MERLGAWFSRGKLLITGEYLVMEGAKAFAVPLKQGQVLELFQTHRPDTLLWEAHSPRGLWFVAEFSLPDLNFFETNDQDKAAFLKKLLETVRKYNENFLNDKGGYFVRTQLGFLPEFGFGSSSTLINNLASWAAIDPYALQFKTLGGSGYDIACASAETAGIYQLHKGMPSWKQSAFTPPFTDRLHLVYLGNKQNSRKEIRRFKNKAVYGKSDIQKVTAITESVSTANNLSDFRGLLEEHEALMSHILNREPVKKVYFNHWDVTAKSLGAWGGDFVLLATECDQKYLYKKLREAGFLHIFAWKDLVV